MIVVKYHAWEEEFAKLLGTIRARELAALWARSLTMVANGVVFFGAPVNLSSCAMTSSSTSANTVLTAQVITSVVTFLVHTTVLGKTLNAETAFTALALFNLLRGPLESFTDMIVNVLQASVSLNRLHDYLQEEESEKYTPRATFSDSFSSAPAPLIGFNENASFTWESREKALADPAVFRLKNLNVTFPVGCLSIIVGPGKCSIYIYGCSFSS